MSTPSPLNRMIRPDQLPRFLTGTEGIKSAGVLIQSAAKRIEIGDLAHLEYLEGVVRQIGQEIAVMKQIRDESYRKGATHHDRAS